MSLLIFSHTDYSLLWPIIEESIEKCKIQNLNKIFCCNETKIIKPKGFEKYIEYDKNLCYAKRWTDNILPFVESEFILILHDVQVIINFNEKFITNIIEIMNKNNIEFRRGNAGGGNQLRQPYLKGIIKWNVKDFKNVELVHHCGYYIGNFPNLKKNKIIKICKILNQIEKFK